MNKNETVYVVDDDVSMREAVSGLLRSHGFHTVAYDSARLFLEQCSLDGASCIVLDVSMPEMSGLELQQYLVDLGETVPIVFITAYGDIPMTVKAIKSGAVEFLQKPVNDERLVEAVRLGLEQDRLNQTRLSEMANIKYKIDSLTPRELEIMKEAVKGRLNKQIAAELGVAEVTVKVHRHNLMQKMGVRSVAELVSTMEKYKELLGT